MRVGGRSQREPDACETRRPSIAAPYDRDFPATQQRKSSRACTTTNPPDCDSNLHRTHKSGLGLPTTQPPPAMAGSRCNAMCPMSLIQLSTWVQWIYCRTASSVVNSTARLRLASCLETPAQKSFSQPVWGASSRSSRRSQLDPWPGKLLHELGMSCRCDVISLAAPADSRPRCNYISSTVLSRARSLHFREVGCGTAEGVEGRKKGG